MGMGDAAVTHEVFSTSAVCRIAGVSLRQLQWWDERAIIVPQQRAHSRQYTREDVRRVKLIAQLRKKKVGLKQIRMVLADLGRALERRSYVIVQPRGTHMRPRVTAYDTPASAFVAASKVDGLVAVLSLEDNSDS